MDTNTTRQFVTFAGVGAIGTAGHYLTLIILVELLGGDPVYSSGAGFVVGALINYVLNYRYTFNSKKRHTEALTKFLLVAVVGAAVNGMVMYMGVEILRINYLLVQIVATGMVLIQNFIFNKYWTFSHSRAGPE